VVKLKFNSHLKDNGVTTFTFWVTWPFNSRWAISYGWSIVTMHLSVTVMEIWRLKCWTDACTHGRTLSCFRTLSRQ